uniref:exocyst complex component 4-like n=1 Tax=Myxine glutinosa TaxID=7769 RepID=UPI00358E73C9
MAAEQRLKGTSKSKDPSGLLISVIRTLSTSDDAHDREIEKRRLQEAYDHCDHELDDKIVQHYTELTSAIKTYNSITERIDTSRCKIAQVRENLLSCKSLLHCKRDELRKLWVEGVEHKHVLALLADIESIRQVRHQMDQAMASKRYLHATDILVDAVDCLTNRLAQVEGLSDLSLELQNRKMKLHLVLIEELNRHLYIRSTSCVGPSSFQPLGTNSSTGHGLDVDGSRKSDGDVPARKIGELFYSAHSRVLVLRRTLLIELTLQLVFFTFSMICKCS